MAEMDRLINVYSEILTLYREGKEAYNTRSFHGMTVDDNNRLNEKISALINDDFSSLKNVSRNIYSINHKPIRLVLSELQINNYRFFIARL